MKKLIAVAFVSASLLACGGSKKAATTPENTGATEMKSGETGGQSYGAPAGGATTPEGDTAGGGSTGASSDPCAGGE